MTTYGRTILISLPENWQSLVKEKKLRIRTISAIKTLNSVGTGLAYAKRKIEDALLNPTYVQIELRHNAELLKQQLTDAGFIVSIIENDDNHIN